MTLTIGVVAAACLMGALTAQRSPSTRSQPRATLPDDEQYAADGTPLSLYAG